MATENTNLIEVEAQYQQVQKDLKKVGDDLKTYAEQSQKEIRQHARLSEETRARVDELLSLQGELKARLEAAEQALGERSGGSHAPRQSLGEMVANSEEFAANALNLTRSKGSFSVSIKSAVTSVTGSGGDAIEPDRVPGVVTPPGQGLTVRDLLSWGRTSSNSIEFVRETGFTNSADSVDENPAGGKPESDLTFELASAPIATIAHWLHATRQVLTDAPMLQGYIDGRLMYGLKLKEEQQLLNGSGVGLNINGIYTQAQAYADPGVEANVTSMTAIDRLRIAMLQVQLAEYAADGLVLHPTDWTTIELSKDANNAYLFSNPTQTTGPTLWGLPVVATQAMTAGEFLTGAFRMGAQGWDREDASIIVSTEDRDNIIKNMVTILCEERVGLTVYRPEAFAKGSLTIV